MKLPTQTGKFYRLNDLILQKMNSKLKIDTERNCILKDIKGRPIRKQGARQFRDAHLGDKLIKKLKGVTSIKIKVVVTMGPIKIGTGHTNELYRQNSVS